MGTATVEAYPDVVARMENDHGVRILQKSDMGDGVFLCTIETPLLREGYHGQVDVILGVDQIRFRRTVDT